MADHGVEREAVRGALAADERTALVDTLRRLLADRCSEAEVRRVMDTPLGHDTGLWRELATLGLTGLIVPEHYGGSGLGAVELGLVFEATGAALLPAPLLSSGVLVPALLAALGDEDASARLLPGIADGSLLATVALTGSAQGWRRDAIAVSAQRDGDAWRLQGRAAFVTDAASSDVLLVAATAEDGLAIFEVPVGAAGLTVTPLPTFDRTRRLADCDFHGTPARRLDGDAWHAITAALDWARIALAGEQAGGAAKVLAMTVGYAQTRIQFGRPIGGFQAVKHMAADLMLESESATSAARHAAERFAAGAPDAEQAIALAGFACADAFVKVAADAIQLHGGIAFTWDHPAHLYLRRARADAQLFGNAAESRERFVRALEQAA